MCSDIFQTTAANLQDFTDVNMSGGYSVGMMRSGGKKTPSGLNIFVTVTCGFGEVGVNSVKKMLTSDIVVDKK